LLELKRRHGLNLREVLGGYEGDRILHHRRDQNYDRQFSLLFHVTS